MRRLSPTLVAFLVVMSISVSAQESREHHSQIRGAIMMANSHIPNATEGGRKVVIIPTWALDVDYFFHPHWSAALQGDIKLQSFEVETDHVVFERTNPVALVAVLHYHAVRHWSFYAGPGYEFEQHENLFLLRLGTEYSFEVTEDFEIALNFAYENKEEVYDAWTFGIAFNKKLWPKSKLGRHAAD